VGNSSALFQMQTRLLNFLASGVIATEIASSMGTIVERLYRLAI
jgi:hypothetical protein